MHVRDFAPADLDAVLALRAEVFDTRDEVRERRRWEWEFHANPARRDSIPCGWVLEHEGNIIGNYSLLPATVVLDGRSLAAVCGMDFCVSPAQQGLGLGMLLTRKFMDPALCDIAFVTSPTKAATELTRYFGAAVLVGADEPCLWVRPGPAATPPGSWPLRVAEIDSFDARFDAWFERLARHYRLLSLRDAKMLNWRYRDYPFGRPLLLTALDSSGDLRGLAVLQEDPALRRGYLLELLVEPQDTEAAATLAAAATAAAQQRGLAEVYVLHRVPAVQAALAAAGFQRVEGHPLTFLCRLPDAGVTLADWYLSSGDGDLLFSVGGVPA